jgi:hypothetical protein
MNTLYLIKEGEEMERIPIQITKPQKKFLDGKKADGASYAGYIRALLDRAMRGGGKKRDKSAA